MNQVGTNTRMLRGKLVVLATIVVDLVTVVVEEKKSKRETISVVSVTVVVNLVAV